jgi:succinate-semialdehyde dehydrogenase/glutarate-semialdehyde dehydrogenase
VTDGATAVERMVLRSRAAQAAWAALPVEERCRILDAGAAALFRRRDRMAQCISSETRKPLAEAMVAEVCTTLDIARFTTRMAPAVLAAEHRRSSSLALWRKRIVVHHEPWGVVGVIAPWNYPLMLPASHILASLAAGNSVICKPSELTPETARQFQECLQAGGLPEDVLQVLPGNGRAGQALIAHGVDRVCFTGSVATGRLVAAQCGTALIPCSLELGGSDPALVLEDANVELAARGITWGRFTNAGQTCVAPKRVFVVEQAWGPFLDALNRRVGALRAWTPGSTEWDVGPVISDAAASAMERQRADATSRGARVVADAGVPGVPGPTILVDVPADAAILREETFGPLLPVVRVRNTEEAIAAANGGPFGLSASVWTRSRQTGEAVAARLRAGTVVVNDVALIAGMAEVPHGGVGQSGYGRLHGIEGLQEAVRTRTVVSDLFPNWAQPWWFPYGAGFRRQVDGYVRLSHGRSLVQRLSGLRASLELILRR